VAGVFNEPKSSARYSRNQLALTLGRKQEVVSAGHYKRRCPDLTEPIDHGPTSKQVPAGKDERLRPHLGTQLAADQVARQRHETGVRVIGAAELHQRRHHLVWRHFAAEEALDCRLCLCAVTATG